MTTQVKIITPTRPHETVRLFGISIHNVTMDQAVETIKQWVEEDGKHIVTTPNVDHIVQLHQNEEFVAAYQEASLIVPDGMPLVWASRFLGKPLKERICGTDLFSRVCQLAQEKGFRVFFLGGKLEDPSSAMGRLQQQFPQLSIAGHYAPPFGFEKDPAENHKIVQLIGEAKTDILFIAVGAPKQEKWVAAHKDVLDFKAALCVGSALDCLTGVEKRAPRWMQKNSLEWFWRLMQDPKRLWKRYLIRDLAFLGIFLKELFGKQRKLTS